MCVSLVTGLAKSKSMRFRPLLLAFKQESICKCRHRQELLPPAQFLTPALSEYEYMLHP